jgi:transposase
MIAQLHDVGIDVSKHRLDVHVHPAGEAFSCGNDRPSLRMLIARLRRWRIAAIGLEASGGYEGEAASALVEAGFIVYLLDPAQVRAFARSMKTRAKTDPIDAAMIARYVLAARDVLLVYRRDADREGVAAINLYRRKLVEERNGLLSLLDTVGDTMVRRSVERRLTVIRRELLVLQREIEKRLAASPALAERCARLRRLPGVGPVLAATLIAELPELCHIGAKRIASLVGVAPHARQSGQTDKGGKCCGGRKQVRDVLYMATLSAIKAKMPHLEPFYRRLRVAGKPFKKALVASMRKFLTILNAIIRDNAEFKCKPT